MLPYSGFPALPNKMEDMHKQLVALGLNDVDALTARIKKCEAWVAAVEETELTGNPVVFQNALAVPAVSLKTTIEAIQDLHGYDKPWAGGAGDNMLDLTALNTGSGVTKTVANDRLTITADGTSGSYQSVYFGNTTTLPFTPGTYYIKLKCISNSNPDLTAAAGFRNSQNAFTGQSISLKTTGEKSVSVTLNEACYFSIMINSNEADRANTVVLDDIIISKTDVPYSPYSNICPISGRTEARVDTENEDSSESAYATIQLGQTVYGAEVNWDTGVVTLISAKKVLTASDVTGVSGNQKRMTITISGVRNAASDSVADDIIQSDKFKALASQDTYSGNIGISVNTVGAIGIAIGEDLTLESAQQYVTDNAIEVVYPLATPTTLQLTPAQLELLKGYNRVSIDNGSIEIKAYTGGPWEVVTRATKKVTNKTKTTKKRRK